MNTQLQSYIFIGPSGSGKGTQSSLLTEALKKKDPNIQILHIETGNELRAFKKTDNYTAQLTRNVIDTGGLMPEFMPIYLWGKLFVERFTGKETLIFDGTPRKLMEARVLESVFSFYNLAKPWVIYLDVHDEELVRRLTLRGRTDDSAEAIKSRLSWYMADVAPSVEFFRTNQNFRFLDIDGRNMIPEVHADIVKKIGLE